MGIPVMRTEFFVLSSIIIFLFFSIPPELGLLNVRATANCQLPAAEKKRDKLKCDFSNMHTNDKWKWNKNKSR